jgi:DNA replication and repair protein RecF
MILKSIEVQNFRNIKHTELEFSAGINLFYGNNAQGKTNLLEAIAVCLGKSFRNIRRSDILPFDSTDSEIKKTKITLSYESESLPGKINKIIFESDRNNTSIQINSIPLKKAAELYGEFKYVVFIPDNLTLIKGEPALRRNYLDNIAIMQNKAHRKFLGEYNSALKQRCAAYFTGGYDNNMLTVWDDVLAKQGINLTYGRLKYLELIRQYACEIYDELSGGENLAISYDSNVFTNKSDSEQWGNSVTDFTDITILYDIYAQKLRSVNCEGQSSKTPGAHKDDVLFMISGNSARNYASQGQLRSIAISLKLAEAQIIRDFNRENSVVLLDEVLGELDKVRRGFVIKHFAESQVFITSCNRHDFENLPDIKIWSVEDGVFISRE